MEMLHLVVHKLLIDYIFREGRGSVKDDPRTGSPKTSVDDNQVELVRQTTDS